MFIVRIECTCPLHVILFCEYSSVGEGDTENRLSLTCGKQTVNSKLLFDYFNSAWASTKKHCIERGLTSSKKIA